jgi:hypothetical protein
VGRGGGARLKVPPVLAEQLLAELLTFAAFAENVQMVHQQIATMTEEQLHVGMSWRDEGRVWQWVLWQRWQRLTFVRVRLCSV